ncbi:hypothetical protein M0R45_027996 [Rubus argutus]|uniref:PHD-type domain-containing protein n=1 Tax=Rubus argutus TaxID=59490 RepID=A0AAW1W414_RUBAR
MIKSEDHSNVEENICISADDGLTSQSLNKKLNCTACNKLAAEVHSHPLLKVIICADCKCFLEEKKHVNDPDCSMCYCGWCGQSNDLLSCKSCTTLFCTTCVKRNIGEECLSKAQTCGWQCCSCCPSLLQTLTLQFEEAMGSGDLIVSSSDSDSDDSDADMDVAISSKRKRKEEIRRIIDDAELGEETKEKLQLKGTSRAFLKSLQVQFSVKSKMKCAASYNGNYLKVLMLKCWIMGVRFMWENIIQSVREVKSGDKGLGCILAHMMGLGKTLQVITFLYTAMRSIDLGLKTALIVTPVNVLHNWRQEFLKWRPSEVKPLRVFMLEDVSRERRLENLSLGKHVKDRHMAREICQALQDGPDILVCDEAHNNLMEYYCMVDFVREGFLEVATSLETEISYSVMKQLKGFVQRMDMSVVKKDLPPKTVFVIAVRLSPLQKKLYKRFLDVHGFTNDKIHSEKMKGGFFCWLPGLSSVLCNGKSFFVCRRYGNHPGILQLRKDNKDYVRHEDGVENFLADDSSSDENTDYIGEKQGNINEILPGKKDDGFFQKDWWNDLIHENNYKELDYSGKMVLLLDVLAMCSAVGDKALVFSQSIPTLDLIELYLSRLPRHGKRWKTWKKGKDWFRLDGRTESSERQKMVERFNDPVCQTKPVFAYRLMAHGTMEEKIYKRQVTKEGLSARVVDRQQLKICGKQEPHLSHGNSSSDKLMESLLDKHYPRWIANFHLHETLLQEMKRKSYQKRSKTWLGKYTGNLTPPATEMSSVAESKVRNTFVQRKCTKLSHVLTLRSQGTKSGCTTVCGECAREISWEGFASRRQ